MQEGSKTLSYAVRGRVIAKYLGELALMLAALTLVPATVSAYLGEYSNTYRYVLVIGLLGAYGLATARLEVPGNLQTNEALTIAALVFLISPLLMTVPLMGYQLSFSDALFEAISAVSTTGLSTVADVQGMSRSFLFSRAWMQWYGGLGIVILSVALFMKLSIAARRLTEPLNKEAFVSSSRSYARHMLVVYLVITGISLAAVWLATGDFFLSVTHVFAAISTGGFSTLNNSLAGIPSISGQAVITAVTIVGALPLPLFYVAWQRGYREFVSDVELKGLLSIMLIVCVLLSWLLVSQFSGDWRSAVYHGVMLGISAQTTTGFVTISVADLSAAAQLLLIASMVVGGCSASTAGGIKILRFLIVMRLIQLLVQRTTTPSHALVKQTLGGRSLKSDEIELALMLVLLFLVVVTVSWLIFLLYGYDPLPALFEVVSATATVGLSAGVTHSEMPTILKWVLSIDMLLGRLEVIAFLVLLYPRNWYGLRTKGDTE